jgi:hypothetical protein
LGRTQFREVFYAENRASCFPEIPHHITQRGNCGENVFFTNGDRATCLGWLAHYRVNCGLADDYVLTKDLAWQDQINCFENWSEWLAEPDQQEQMTVLRQHVERGLPCGTEEFVRGLEFQTGQILRPTPVGRPKKNEHGSLA